MSVKEVGGVGGGYPQNPTKAQESEVSLKIRVRSGTKDKHF